MQNHRGSLLFTAWIIKIFTNLLHNRLNKWLNSHTVLTEFQSKHVLQGDTLQQKYISFNPNDIFAMINEKRKEIMFVSFSLIM